MCPMGGLDLVAFAYLHSSIKNMNVTYCEACHSRVLVSGSKDEYLVIILKLLHYAE